MGNTIEEKWREQFKSYANRDRGSLCSPDNETKLSYSNGTVELSVADTRRVLRTSQHQCVDMGPAFSQDSQRLAFPLYDGSIRIWNAKSGEELHVLETGTDSDFPDAWQLIFSPDSRMLASCSTDETIRIWDANRGERLQFLECNQLACMGFCPDSEKLVFSDRDNGIRLWRTETGNEPQIFEKGHSERVISVVFSPDGQMVASGSEDGTARVWDVVTRRCIRVIQHRDEVAAIAFSLDSQTVASGSDDGVVILWNIKSEPRAHPRVSASGVCSLEFSPNGKVVASHHYDGNIIFWEFDTGKATSIGT